MVVFFPTPLPGELYYSIIARYFRATDDPSPKSMLTDLFGNPNVTASVDMPAHVGKLIERLPIGSKITERRLIWEHTLFPFYTAFLPLEQKETIYKEMVYGDGNSIALRSGLMASAIRYNTYFRYCPLCSREDIEERYGFLYWYRNHQIPGMDICLEHGTWLINSQVLIQQENRHLYIPPSGEACPLNELVTFVTDSNMLERYRLFGKHIEKLLNTKFTNRPYHWFENMYISKLQEKGFASVTSGRVDQEKLRSEFIDFYGEEFLQNMQSSLNEKDNWLSTMTRRHRKSFHPIRHILLMNFLDITLEELFEGDVSFKPFGEGPWICHNPAAEHFSYKTISEVSLSACERTKKIIGTFACSCGMIYSRRVGDDDSRQIRVKTYGAVWEQECKRLDREGLSLREIGRRLSVDPTTVKKYIQIQVRVEPGEDETKQLPQYVADKIDWIQLCDEHPELSKQQIRQLNPALYARLYRNAKAWLAENAPDRKQRPKGREKVGWGSRDIELLDMVKVAVEEILNVEGKPKRITISRIGYAVGKRALLEKHYDKLPLTKAFLDLNVESVEQFRIRRIKWAIHELEQEGKKIIRWEVLKKAGIRPEHVKDEL